MASLETIDCRRQQPGSQRHPPLFRFFHPDRGNFIVLVSDHRSRRTMLRFAELLRRHGDVPHGDVSLDSRRRLVRSGFRRRASRRSW